MTSDNPVTSLTGQGHESAAVLAALRAQYLGGVGVFGVVPTADLASRLAGHAVSKAQIRAVLRRLAGAGFLTLKKGGRFLMRGLLVDGQRVYYERRPAALAPGALWITSAGDDERRAVRKAGRALERGAYGDARRVLAGLVESDDIATRARAYRHLAEVEMAADDREKAGFCFKEALKRGADEFAHMAYARFLKEGGDLAGALAALEAATRTFPGSAGLWDALAGVSERMGAAWRGEYYAFRALEAEAGFIPVMAGMADTELAAGNPEEAAAMYALAARRHRRNVYPLYRMAYIMANQLSDRAGAIALFEKIGRINREDRLAAKNIAALENENAQLEERIECPLGDRTMVWTQDRPGAIEFV